MKKMTRILAMILVMCMLLMTGCSQESPEDTTPQGEGADYRPFKGSVGQSPGI